MSPSGAGHARLRRDGSRNCRRRPAPLTSGVKRGLAVMIEIRPAEVLRPNRVPCGPRSTSIRSSGAEFGQADAGARAIDAVDEHADRAFEAGVVADRADAADAGDGRAGFGRGRGDEQRRRNLVELADVGRAAYSAACSAVTALTAIGTSDSAWLRRVAVMTMSPVSTGCCSRAWSWTAAASAVAPAVGCAVCLSVSVSVTLRSAQMPESRGRTSPAESSHADLRIMFLSPSGATRPVWREANPESRSKGSDATWRARNNAAAAAAIWQQQCQ